MSNVRYRARRSAGSIPIEYEQEDGSFVEKKIRVRVMDHALLRQISAVAAQAKEIQDAISSASDEEKAIKASSTVDWLIEQINLLSLDELSPDDFEGIPIEDLNALLQEMSEIAARSTRHTGAAEKKR